MLPGGGGRRGSGGRPGGGVRRRIAAVAAASAAILGPRRIARRPRGAVDVAAPATIDGPSADVVSLGGVDARAGRRRARSSTSRTSAASRTSSSSLETAGAWAAGVEVDAASAAAASAPSVAVGRGGRVAVVWIAAARSTAPSARPARGVHAPQRDRRRERPSPRSAWRSAERPTSPTRRPATVGVARLDRTPRPASRSLGAPGSATRDHAAPREPDAGGRRRRDGRRRLDAGAGDGATHVFVARASRRRAEPGPRRCDRRELDGVAGGAADSAAVGVEFDSSDAWVAFRETFGGLSRADRRRSCWATSCARRARRPLARRPTARRGIAPALAVDGNGAGPARERDWPRAAASPSRRSARRRSPSLDARRSRARGDTVAPAPLAAPLGETAAAWSPTRRRPERSTRCLLDGGAAARPVRR